MRALWPTDAFFGGYSKSAQYIIDLYWIGCLLSHVFKEQLEDLWNFRAVKLCLYFLGGLVILFYLLRQLYNYIIELPKAP